MIRAASAKVQRHCGNTWTDIYLHICTISLVLVGITMPFCHTVRLIFFKPRTTTTDHSESFLHAALYQLNRLATVLKFIQIGIGLTFNLRPTTNYPCRIHAWTDLDDSLWCFVHIVRS